MVGAASLLVLAIAVAVPLVLRKEKYECRLERLNDKAMTIKHDQHYIAPAFGRSLGISTNASRIIVGDHTSSAYIYERDEMTEAYSLVHQ